jgi:hypothetical protein
MLSVCRRVIDSGGISSELVWVCRAAKSCKKRMEGAGVIFQTFAANPPRKAKLPASYLKRCKATGHKPITANYAVWLVRRGGSPSVVPADFTTAHLDQLPLFERQRWLKASRRRYLAAKRKGNPGTRGNEPFQVPAVKGLRSAEGDRVFGVHKGGW